MKIDKNKKVISIMLLISMILSVFIPINKVFAKEINNAITAFTITDENNKPLGSVGQYDQFKIHGEFELEDNIVEEGDTTTIKLPSKLTIGDTMNFDLKDPKGNIVARATVDKEKKTITLTYTDYSESHSGVNGSFYYYARVDSEVVTEKEKFPVEIDVEGEIIKAGEIDYEGPSGKPADNYLFKGSDPDPINKNILNPVSCDIFPRFIENPVPSCTTLYSPVTSSSFLNSYLLVTSFQIQLPFCILTVLI